MQNEQYPFQLKRLRMEAGTSGEANLLFSFDVSVEGTPVIGDISDSFLFYQLTLQQLLFYSTTC